MKKTASLTTVVTLANAAELACCIAKEVVGNDISDVVGDSPITNDMVRGFALAQIQTELTIFRGGVNA